MKEDSSKGRWLKYAGIGAEHRKKEVPHQDEKTGDKQTGEDITSLGSLEAELLGVLWQIGKPATSMEIMEAALYKRRAQGAEPAAFATIATTLRRMSAKGLLDTEKPKHGALIYWPTVEREQMAARILNNVSQTLLGFPLHGLLPKLIGQVRSQTSSNTSASNASAEAAVDQAALENADLQSLLKALEELAKKQK